MSEDNEKKAQDSDSAENPMSQVKTAETKQDSSEVKAEVKKEPDTHNKADVSRQKQKRKLTVFAGRRKSSVARVRVSSGSGKFMVNKKEMEKYFTTLDTRKEVKRPLLALSEENNFDVFVNVCGGGFRGQAGAISLAISRALVSFDPKFHRKLRTSGLLTRDSRMVERKKYGLHKARRAPQFSKR